MPKNLQVKIERFLLFEDWKENSYRPQIALGETQNEELRSVVTVFRHGDRTPK